ncbi:MAG: ABC transporter permease subunit [Treponema sp.]|jgi:ABC-2 type transport system permease protein|nr:ABC transporter permease subunit [Treponema sp.]
MTAILKRELKSYFLTPLGYIYMGFFLLLTGVFFTFMNLLSQSPQYTGFLGNVLFIYLFAIPILTMRLFSEERRQKTDQLLLTSPVSISGIVLGKFFAALALYLLTLVITVFYALVIAAFGELAVWETVGSYIGFIFLGASYIAVGIFVSAGTENQFTAALISFFSLLLIWIIDPIINIVPSDMMSGLIFAALIALLAGLFLYLNMRNLYLGIGVALAGGLLIVLLYFFKRDVFSGLIRNTLSWFSLNRRYTNFSLGMLKLEALFYYTSFSGLFLFLTVRLIEKRRWN